MKNFQLINFMNPFSGQNMSLLLENQDIAEALENIMSYQKYPKHHILCKAGSVCNHFYIIISGIARVFYYNEDKDITVHFSMEQESITAIDSFVQRKESKYNVEALEDLEVMAVSYQDLENLFEKHPKHERFGRLFMQHIYIELCERIDDLQLNNAMERYNNLLSNKPALFQRVPLKHLASFLSITPETLSRIRGNK